MMRNPEQIEAAAAVTLEAIAESERIRQELLAVQYDTALSAAKVLRLSGNVTDLRVLQQQIERWLNDG